MHKLNKRELRTSLWKQPRSCAIEANEASTHGAARLRVGGGFEAKVLVHIGAADSQRRVPARRRLHAHAPALALHARSVSCGLSCARARA
eukprot:101815-Pleurochrysis_carterae.AAC.1